MEAKLKRLGPNAETKILRIPNGCRTKIWLAGRGTSCLIYTKSIFASRQHFSITYKEQKYFISDLQSSNGTFLNDEKLEGEKELTSGNIISVGVPSEMQDSPDCIVYVFELNSNILSSLPAKDMKCSVLELKNDCVGQSAHEVQSVITNVEQKCTKEEFCSEYVEVERSNVEIENTALNDSSSSDVILIEPSNEPEKPNDSLCEPRPAKIRKIDDCLVSQKNEKNEEKPEETDTDLRDEEMLAFKALTEVDEPRPAKIRKIDGCLVSQKNEKNEEKPKETDTDLRDEEMLAYEALTQVDEVQVKSEPDLLNYSQTEELIEISDSEDDWAPGLKLEGNKSPEIMEGDDDGDDVVILETIISEKKKDKFTTIVVEDDMTEVDKKWIGQLLKIKKEELLNGGQEVLKDRESGKQKELTSAADMVVDESDIAEGQVVTSNEPDNTSVIPCTVMLSRLSTNDIVVDKLSEPAPEIFPRVEIPRKIVKRVQQFRSSKKSVTFDMVPQIRYFEVPSRAKLTASEKGRLRLTRIIFNICNWNTHWLEECKRLAPDKVPHDICEERLRKIPKKFPSHSDYMVAFIPAMLLQLWNRIKDKWVSSGETGFKQTMSCDSCEDYHAENLSVYKCTGLVQSVNAHKQLLREGHLVLLRLHQVQAPEFITPAAEKYSKKLGYLVFGFVKSKIYERYHDQPLHRSLAERCGSVLGDLHIVRLTILVKKRPSFQIDKQKLIQLTVVQQISQEIRMFRGICLLPDSPLCQAILKPTEHEVPLVEPPEKDLIFKGPIDEVQGEIVRKLSHACSTMSSLLYSIQGASGTGKGQVICALILQLLYGSEWKVKRPKIIYCTQWSIPLDEMVTKLKVVRQTLEEPFKLVRIGPIREVKPSSRDLCVSNLASSITNSDKRPLDSRNFDAEIEVIKEADVLCTTCTSAGTAKMCAAFEKLLIKDRDLKVICIIDEAMSCKETDSVIPLLLGVTHLILVGDIYQMEPTVSGEKTRAVGLDMSLFWRIYKNFINVPEELRPLTTLGVQYRMNSSLSNFTSQLIYNTLLRTPSESVSHRIANIKSHLLLLDQTPDNVAKEERENREVKIVSQLTKAVVRLTRASVTKSARFGVIMLDTKQIESLQVLLPKREYPEVEIDQIQSFQGKELDIVIFVCDARKIFTSWLVTALTRARRSLLIFGSRQSISGNSLFRKIACNAGECNFLKYVHPDMTLSEFEELIVDAVNSVNPAGGNVI